MGRRPKTYAIVTPTVVKKGWRPGYEPKSKVASPAPVSYQCTRCKRWKLASKMAHDRRRGSHQHLSSWCKDCRKEYMKEYRQTHKDQIKIAHQEWRRQRKPHHQWRGMREDSYPRVSHCWLPGAEVWISRCGLERQEQQLMTRSRREGRCLICLSGENVKENEGSGWYIHSTGNR